MRFESPFPFFAALAAASLAACAPGATTEVPAPAPRSAPVAERGAERSEGREREGEEDAAAEGDAADPRAGALAKALAQHSRRGPELTGRVAEAVLHEADRHEIEASLLAAVLLTENTPLDTSAVSRAGAVGLMQVMRFHAGKYDCESKNLRELANNVCHGAHVLRYNLDRAKDVRRALLGYNGCVGRRRTSRCSRYPAKVLRYEASIRQELARAAGRDRTAVAKPASAPELPEGFALGEVRVREGDWLAGRKLKDARLERDGMAVLRLTRGDGGRVIDLPDGGTRIEADDVLLVYGPAAVVARVAKEPGARARDEVASR